jgi:hypothetical protein
MGALGVSALCAALSRHLLATVAIEDVSFKLRNFSAFVFHARGATGLPHGVSTLFVFALALLRAVAIAHLEAPRLRRWAGQVRAPAATRRDPHASLAPVLLLARSAHSCVSRAIRRRASRWQSASFCRPPC